MTNPVNIQSGNLDPEYGSILRGWELKKSYSSNELSRLTPFVQIFSLIKEDNSIKDIIPNEFKYNVRLIDDVRGGEFASPEDISDVILCPIAYLESQIKSSEEKGGVGILQLRVSREIRTVNSAIYDLNFQITDPNLFDKRPYMSQLLTLGTSFVIIYGWVDEYAFDYDNRVRSLFQNIPNYYLYENPPIFERNSSSNRLVLGRKNMGFWTSARVILHKFSYNLDNVGQIVANASFVGESYAKAQMERANSIIPNMEKMLNSLNTNYDNIDFKQLLIRFWSNSTFRFPPNDVSNLYTGQYSNISYNTLIFYENINDITKEVRSIEDLKEGNKRFYITNNSFRETLAKLDHQKQTYVISTDPATGRKISTEGQRPPPQPQTTIGADLMQKVSSNSNFQKNNPFFQLLSNIGYGIYRSEVDNIWRGTGFSSNQRFDLPSETNIYANFKSRRITDYSITYENDLYKPNLGFLIRDRNEVTARGTYIDQTFDLRWISRESNYEKNINDQKIFVKAFLELYWSEEKNFDVDEIGIMVDALQVNDFGKLLVYNDQDPNLVRYYQLITDVEFFRNRADIFKTIKHSKFLNVINRVPGLYSSTSTSNILNSAQKMGLFYQFESNSIINLRYDPYPNGYIMPRYESRWKAFMIWTPPSSSRGTQFDDNGNSVFYQESGFDEAYFIGKIPFKTWSDAEGRWIWQLKPQNSADVRDYLISRGKISADDFSYLDGYPDEFKRAAPGLVVDPNSFIVISGDVDGGTEEGEGGGGTTPPPPPPAGGSDAIRSPINKGGQLGQ